MAEEQKVVVKQEVVVKEEVVVKQEVEEEEGVQTRGSRKRKRVYYFNGEKVTLMDKPLKRNVRS